MAKSSYTIATDEGALRYGGEVGDTVELELGTEEEQAVIAAGWLEPTTTKTTKKGE
jgi:hypothetical protein